LEHESEDPDLPVEEGIFDEFIFEVLAATIVIEEEPLLERLTFGLSEEFSGGGVVIEHPERCDSDDDGKDTFEDEDPALYSVSDEGSVVDKQDSPILRSPTHHPSS